MILIVFGLPATGKTFVANILAKHEFFFYEGDVDMHEDLLETIANKQQVNDQQRDIFFNKLIANIKTLSHKHKNLVVAQTFIKERYRKQLIEQIPDAIFILVTTETNVREERLKNRTTYRLDPEYAKRMCELFEKPSIPYISITNTTDGEKEIERQVKDLFINSSNK